MINKNTKIFYSISSKPGNFGATFFNLAFEKIGIDAIYKPLKLDESFLNTVKFNRFISIHKDMGTSGMSISMPFKRIASVDVNIEDYNKDIIRNIGNINTLVFRDKYFPYCYNTDHIAFERVCENLLNDSKTAYVYGTGAISNSISYILNKKEIEHKKNKNNFFEADFLINATPIGMEGVEDKVFTEEIVSRYKYIFDVVPNNESNLLKIARKLNKKYVCGSSMQFENSMEQFKIYTDQEIDRDFMLNKMKDNNHEIF
jgi:shikimate dehydrogenase